MGANKTMWTMKSGKKIDIDSMDIDHLRNVLKMIVRNSEQAKADKFFNISDRFNMHEHGNN